MHLHFLRSTFLSLAISLAFPCSLHAQGTEQTPDSQEQSQNPDAAVLTVADDASQTITLDDALKATPPERRKSAQLLYNSPDAAAQIDAWIAQTEVDNPQNLILKDLLLAMPIAFAGPRLTELAKKSNDPNIQQNWANWLEKYPDAYAQVLVAWIKLNQENLPRLAALLADYYKIRPQISLHIWAQYIAKSPLKELKSLYQFGIGKPLCAPALTELLVASDDEITQLRILRALAHCEDASGIPPEHVEPLDIIILGLLNHTAPSRRIAALDVIGTVKPQNAEILTKAEALRKDAKNSTERAVALRSLARIDPAAQSDNIKDALINGDETMRLEAAALLANLDSIALPEATLKEAFSKEIWPETQMQLYQAMVRHSKNSAELGKMRKSILLDESRAMPLRSAVLEDIVKNTPELLALSDMEKLITQKAPLDLIAQTGESIYTTTPAARPKLRSWLEAQQPFERRILATFARFMHIDAKEKDASAIDFMRKICNSEQPQESTIQPCLIYFEANAQTDQDREIVEKLQRRQAQFDAMMNLEF